MGRRRAILSAEPRAITIPRTYALMSATMTTSYANSFPPSVYLSSSSEKGRVEGLAIAHTLDDVVRPVARHTKSPLFRELRPTPPISIIAVISHTETLEPSSESADLGGDGNPCRISIHANRSTIVEFNCHISQFTMF